jgi:hypothetical protein
MISTLSSYLAGLENYSEEGVMLTVTVAAKMAQNGTVTLQLPPQVSPGYHKMVLVIEEAESPEAVHEEHGDDLVAQRENLELPSHNVGPWPENFSLRREDLYDDWGR